MSLFTYFMEFDGTETETDTQQAEYNDAESVRMNAGQPRKWNSSQRREQNELSEPW